MYSFVVILVHLNFSILFINYTIKSKEAMLTLKTNRRYGLFYNSFILWNNSNYLYCVIKIQNIINKNMKNILIVALLMILVSSRTHLKD